MPAPTQEQFDGAPLYRFALPEPEQIQRDWSKEEIIVGGLNLVRADTEVGGFKYSLEGVPIAVGAPHELEGRPAFRTQYLSSDEETVLHSYSREAAIERFGRMIERAVIGRDEFLFLRLQQHGVAADEIVDMAEDEDGDLADLEPDYSEPVRCVRDGYRIWRQGEERPLLWHEAKNDAYRCDEDGNILCSAGQPILNQIPVIGRDNPAGERHVADIRAIRAAIGDAARIPVTDTRYGLHWFDLKDSGVVDSVVSQEALEAYRNDQLAYHYGEREEGADVLPVPVDPSVVVHGRSAERHFADIMREETGLYVPNEEVRTGQLYQDPTRRGVMREMMSPYLGGFPMEHVWRSHAPRDPEGYAAFRDFWAAGEVVMEVPVQTHPSQPGYRTEPGHVVRRDGWDALVFADGMNLYAYAFPSPPDCAPRPAEPEPVQSYAPRM